QCTPVNIAHLSDLSLISPNWLRLQKVAGLFAACVFVASHAVAADSFAYVGNQADGTVSIIDTTTDEVVRTLPDHGKIGTKVQAVIADPAGKTAFVVDAEGNALVVIDIA